MAFENLPGIPVKKLDGNLTLPNTSDAPVVLVLGTSASGRADELFTVARVSDAAAEFGAEGTLTRGMYEANATGASNIRLVRIGAKSAKLNNFAGGTVTIETVTKDGEAGSLYKVHYLTSPARLRIFRAADDLLVYDSGTTPFNKIDLGEVVVVLLAALGSGTALGLGTGLPEDSAVLLEEIPDAASPNGDLNALFIAGDDGVELNRMETYEALQDAYRLLEDADLDILVPQNVYLDDANVMDMTLATASGLMAGITAHEDIGIGSLQDVLGLFREEEFEGQYYYFWDVNRDGVAEITPTITGIDPSAQVLIASGQHSIAAAIAGDPADLDSLDFHEVNFAYQLASFAQLSSEHNQAMRGSIGVRPPNSFTPKDVSIWVGQAPRTVVNAQGIESIVANGKGLLGNKFMAGRISVGTLPAHRAGQLNGGFIATDNGHIDGIELVDAGGAIIDIGKYIDVVSAYALLLNPSRRQQYSATGAAGYAGLTTRIVPGSAPTNKVVPNIQLPFRLAKSKLNELAGSRYVHFVLKRQGVVVVDAPTAARPDSDYTRWSTMKSIEALVDVIRNVGEPYLGEGMDAVQIAALETGLSQAISELTNAGGPLQRFELSVTVTESQRILGEATVDVVVVPRFELRNIRVTVALSAS